MNQRIHTLDGLRFLAALGVLWIHCWTIHGNPRFFAGKIDLSAFLAIGVNGVELFFVISGFCMYYFYASKTEFSYQDFYRFLRKRWIRLSPAFYAATLLYLLVEKYAYHRDLPFFLNSIHSLFYLNYVMGNYQTAAHFWTLTVEWQFYFLLPFLLIYQKKAGFRRCFLLLFGLVFLSAAAAVFLLGNDSDYLTGTFLFRGIEFGFGVLAARLLLLDQAFFKYRTAWFFLFFIIVYSGRVLVSKPALALALHDYNLFKLAGFTLMGAGFAGILYLSVTSTGLLYKVLASKLFKTTGRISYSFYLLHALIYPFVARFTTTQLSFLKNMMAPLATTLISAVILLPLSMLSFRLLEKPFISAGNLTAKS
jgi:peptidoglycan/LPS O-acetylase OafA/YrhL